MHKTYSHTHQRWFAKDIVDIITTLESDLTGGLTSSEAASRLARFGSNELPAPKSRPALLRFIAHFHNILIYILFISAFITLTLQHYTDTIIILAITIINSAIGFFQENNAEQALKRIKTMFSTSAVTLRDGKYQKIPASQLTLGDIALLSPGDRVPADLRLFQANSLTIEESILTGEAVPSDKNISPLDTETPLGDRSNMAYTGTFVRAGTGAGVVVAIGIETEIGHVSQIMSKVESLATPLTRQIDALGKRLSASILTISLAAYILGHFFREYSPVELLLFATSMAIAAIPEGLPAVLSIILVISVQTMAKHKAIIRNLPSVETLGSVSIICSDKTGTLTKNEMTVEYLVTRQQVYTLSGSGYEPYGQIFMGSERAAASPELEQLLKALRICNNAVHEKNEHGVWTIKGDPVEGALLVAYIKSGLSGYLPQRMADIPFDSYYNYMATLVHSTDCNLIYITGAPDTLLAMASHDYGTSGPQTLCREYWEEGIAKLTAQGQQIFGAAYKRVDTNVVSINHDDLHDVCFLGLASMADPPRDEALEAVKNCRAAGITVKMITGDHAEAARYIGNQLGIGTGQTIVTGKQLDDMTTEQFQDAVTHCDIFARTSPEHKLRLVEAVQANGGICAMLGDGVNDAPAIRRADVGVAMGIKGTEVTKEAAEIIIADDNFSTIVAAVAEGRRVYDNLKKTILFMLPINRAESFLIIVSMLLGAPLPLTPGQLLWINMITSVTVALALAFEKAEPDSMSRGPRQAQEQIFTSYFIWRILFVSGVIGILTLIMNSILMRQTGDLHLVRTATVQTIVMCQLFHLVNCRTIRSSSVNSDFFSNKAIFIVSGLVLVLQLSVIYLPFMNHMFNTVPLPFSCWAASILVGFLVFLLVEVEKGVMRKLDERKARGSS